MDRRIASELPTRCHRSVYISNSYAEVSTMKREQWNTGGNFVTQTYLYSVLESIRSNSMIPVHDVSVFDNFCAFGELGLVTGCPKNVAIAIETERDSINLPRDKQIGLNSPDGAVTIKCLISQDKSRDRNTLDGIEDKLNI